MIDPARTQSEIEAHLKASITTFSIELQDYPDPKAIPMLPGANRIRPYGILDFAGVTDMHTGNGITGAADDSYNMTFAFHGVGGSADDAKNAMNKAIKVLLGFVPTNCGEIRPAFYAGIGKASNQADPTRYSAVQAFRLTLNA